MGKVRVSPDHELPSKLDRQVEFNERQKVGTQIVNQRRFNEYDLIVDQIYEVIATGESRTAIILALERGRRYGHEPMSRQNATDIYNAALKRFAHDVDMKHSDLRNIFYKRYEDIYRKQIEAGDRTGARQTLDSMARIFGIEQKGPSTAIQINGTEDGKVTVNFGFTGNGDGD